MTAPNLDPIAVQLRAERKRRNLSLPRAAELVGLEAVVIGSYERGDRTPPLDRLRQWVEGLNHRLLAVPTSPTAEGALRVEFGVAYADRVIPCESEDSAVELRRGLTGLAVVVARAVRTTSWEPLS
ncbi:helix-turn-helix domain-containing protein [Phytohabitans rumicis]|uniref:HTH cro/C1-type domain-containing protein n=1 Tax=Phytohabitans rumicis TaxID=1076125 RepID=A0A6V8LFY8_9ACTN|nr:helix-turn-helix transcriptional regulator [Phytohabitans rumicis]GFJ91555.1 hypothetical protein Prum_051970 [Phytohabitans rumicis]